MDMDEDDMELTLKPGANVCQALPRIVQPLNALILLQDGIDVAEASDQEDVDEDHVKLTLKPGSQAATGVRAAATRSKQSPAKPQGAAAG